MKLTGLLIAAAATALSAPTAFAQTQPAQQRAEAVVVIHAGTLLAVPGETPRRNVSVVVRGTRIAEVRDGFVDVPGARVVDLRDHTVLPGLIDSHVHLSGLDDRIQARLQSALRDNEERAARGRRGRSYVAGRFNWDSTARRLEEIIRAIPVAR